MPLNIVVTGCQPDKATELWPVVQAFVRTMVGEDSGLLTRIRRDDKGCNYRAHGDYTLHFMGYEEHIINLSLRP